MKGNYFLHLMEEYVYKWHNTNEWIGYVLPLKIKYQCTICCLEFEIVIN